MVRAIYCSRWILQDLYEKWKELERPLESTQTPPVVPTVRGMDRYDQLTLPMNRRHPQLQQTALEGPLAGHKAFTTWFHMYVRSDRHIVSGAPSGSQDPSSDGQQISSSPPPHDGDVRDHLVAFESNFQSRQLELRVSRVHGKC